MPESSLIDPKYMGGLRGAGGYRFEDVYLLVQLPDWLAEIDLVAVQQEGWSDVELFFKSDKRQLIQIKDHLVSKVEFVQTTKDFYKRNRANPGIYEKFVIASPGLLPQVGALRKQIERLRNATHYSTKELKSTRAKIKENLAKPGLKGIANFIIDKVYFTNLLPVADDETRLRDTFVGSVARLFKIAPKVAENFYLQLATQIVSERGKPIELQPVREALREKQLESGVLKLTQFDLVSNINLEQYRGEEVHSFFYGGAVPNWSDIVNTLDIPRELTGEILARISSWTKGKLLVPLLAEAGEGKSTVLKRLAVDLTASGKVVLYHRKDALTADASEVESVARMTGQIVYVLIDDAARVENISGFIRSISEIPHSVVVISASRPYEWGPMRKAYSANLEVALAAGGREYALEGLSDNEMDLLFRKLIEAHLIRPLTEEEIKLAVEFHGRKAKRKLLVLILELTRGKKIQEVIRDEIDRVRGLGTETLSAYRYVCLMSSVHSFLTVEMLRDLVNVDNVTLDIITRLPGLVESVGNRLYARHDRIGEMVTDIFFENADKQRCELLCQLISLALEHNHPEVVQSIDLDRTIPETFLFSVANHLFDETYCAGHYDIVLGMFQEFSLGFQQREIFADLLASKTPAIWDGIVFPTSQTIFQMNWDESKWGFSFQWPKCKQAASVTATSDSSVETKLKWADIFAAEWQKHYGFFFTVTRFLYMFASILYKDRETQINFEYAEFLNREGECDEAMMLYAKVLNVEPDNAKAHAGLSLAYYMNGKYLEALRHYKSAKQIDWHSLFRLDWGLFDDMLGRFGDLDELLEYRKFWVQHDWAGMRAADKFLDPFRGGFDLTPTDGTMDTRKVSHQINMESYSEDAEQKALADFDQLIKFSQRASEEQRHELGKRMSHAKFGELRHLLLSSSTSEDKKRHPKQKRKDDRPRNSKRKSKKRTL